MTWGWTPIEPAEELAGDDIPEAEDVRFDERWLSLVLLAARRQCRGIRRYTCRGGANATVRQWKPCSNARSRP
jgi:hypothetical protein